MGDYSVKNTASRAKGRRGEERAAEFIQGLGMKIIARNFTVWGGEIDIVALDNKDGSLVFVEVKTRDNDSFGSGAEAVGKSKREKLLRAAERFISDNGMEGYPARFDIVLVSKSKIERIENAFEA